MMYFLVIEFLPIWFQKEKQLDFPRRDTCPRRDSARAGTQPAPGLRPRWDTRRERYSTFPSASVPFGSPPHRAAVIFNKDLTASSY
jgi:hypothetical protein